MMLVPALGEWFEVDDQTATVSGAVLDGLPQAPVWVDASTGGVGPTTPVVPWPAAFEGRRQRYWLDPRPTRR